MGEVDTENTETIETETQETETTEEQTAVLDAESSEEGQEAESDGIEIVREGSEPEPKKDETPPWMRKQMGKLRGEKREAREEASVANAELERSREENKILRIALEQKQNPEQQPLTQPNAEEFDGGVYDPEFVKAQNEYNQKFIASEVKKGMAEMSQQNSQVSNANAQSKELEKKQVVHYEKANKLGAKDYEATEDKAIAVLGNDVVNHIIANSENSHTVLYFLGKNPGEAEALARELGNNATAIKGVMRLGRLEAELKIRPKSKTIPDPDEELEGGTMPSSGKKNQGPPGAKYE